MKVILLQDIKGIGKRGDLKEVAQGYARNFLFPRKLAEVATEAAVRKVETEKAKNREIEQHELEKFQQLASDIEGKELVIRAKAKEGKLFGSVGPKEIARELKKENFDIGEGSVMMEGPLKETGEFRVNIELPHGIETFITAIVEEEE